MRRVHHKAPTGAVVAVAVVAIAAALYFAREVLIPLALAILLTFLLAPMVHALERRRMPRVPAVMTVVLSVFLAIGILGWVVVGQLWDLANSIDQYEGNIVTKVERLQLKGGLWGKLSRFGSEVERKLEQPTTTRATTGPTELAAEQIAQEMDDPRVITEAAKGIVPNPATQPTKENPVPVAIVQPRPGPMQSLSQYTKMLMKPLGTAGIVVVFVIFMLLSREDMRDRLIRLIGYGQMHVTTRALDDAATRISRYLTAQAIVNGTYGITIAIGLWLIGLTLGDHAFPNVILWGLLCAVLRFVPYVGPWVAAVFPLVVAFAVYPGFAVFVAVMGLFVVIEVLSNNLMEPWLYGASTGMTTVAILVSAVFWTWLWGPIGLLLSTPMTVCLVVIGKHVPQLGFLDVMLGDDPVLEPHERVYQRLLAMDQEEAAEVAEEYLGGMTMEDVYDRVLMPALAMGENDRHRGRLDDARQAFIRDSMRDTVDEVMEQSRMRSARTSAADTEAAARGSEPSKDNGKSGEKREKGIHLPSGSDVSVVVLPAHDAADEIAGQMVGNALQVRGYRVTVMSVTALASEMIETVQREKADVVLVSAMPPAAVTHSRYLCKRLHARFPEIETVVGLWLWKGDQQKARDRITCTRNVRMVTSLCTAVQEIHQAVQPRLMQQSEERKTPSP